MFRQLNFVSGRGRCRIYCRLYKTGNGAIAYLMGGNKPHVGAVALAIPRISLTGRGRSASVSILTVPGHKDDELARPAALKLAASLNCPVTVIAGVHIDDITLQEIGLVRDNATRAVSGIIKISRRESQSREFLKSKHRQSP